MRRKRPIKHTVRTHARQGKLVSSYSRGSGSKIKRFSKKDEVQQHAKIFIGKPKDLAKSEYLILPNASTETMDWREGMRMASSWSGVQSRIAELKEMGFEGGKVLIENEDSLTGPNERGFRLVSSWGKPQKKRKSKYGTKYGKYNVDQDLLEAEMMVEEGKKAKLVWMHPSTFLKQCPSPEIFEPKQYKNADEAPGSTLIDDEHPQGYCPGGYSKPKIDQYEKNIGEGKPLPPLILDKTAKKPFGEESYISHDGRHRAKAAYLMAITRVPVVVIDFESDEE